MATFGASGTPAGPATAGYVPAANEYVVACYTVSSTLGGAFGDSTASFVYGPTQTVQGTVTVVYFNGATSVGITYVLFSGVIFQS